MDASAFHVVVVFGTRRVLLSGVARNGLSRSSVLYNARPFQPIDTNRQVFVVPARGDRVFVYPTNSYHCLLRDILRCIGLRLANCQLVYMSATECCMCVFVYADAGSPDYWM